MKKTNAEPMSRKKIFKIMLYVTFIAAALFAIKDLLMGSFEGAAVVGGCLLAFSILVVIMHVTKLSQKGRQLAVGTSLLFLVFFISLYSGDYYSDDFPLFLAVLGLTGMYLEPLHTLAQTGIATVLLVVLYLCNPQKADPLGQFIMCVAMFDLAAFIMFLVIKRGRAFIDLGIARAEQAEQLVSEMKKIGKELEEYYHLSSERMFGLKEVSSLLEENSNELRDGSQQVGRNAKEMEETCENVQSRVQITEERIEVLNEEVHRVEAALGDSKKHIVEMNKQVQMAKDTVDGTNQIFGILQQQISDIAQITEQLTSISSSTKMLALNASIEAARAGAAGEGFAVVATKVQELAVDSNSCSEQVIQVMGNMTDQIQNTAKQLEDSVEIINVSLNSMKELGEGFDGLIRQFGSLYENIAEQNENVSSVDQIFTHLRESIDAMSACSAENENIVTSITEGMVSYRSFMNLVIEDGEKLNQLSSKMMNVQ